MGKSLFQFKKRGFQPAVGSRWDQDGKYQAYNRLRKHTKRCGGMHEARGAEPPEFVDHIQTVRNLSQINEKPVVEEEVLRTHKREQNRNARQCDHRMAHCKSPGFGVLGVMPAVEC